MATVNITDTETNPTYTEDDGGGGRDFTHTETNPWYFGGGGGGIRSFALTEENPTYKLGGWPPGLPPIFIDLIT